MTGFQKFIKYASIVFGAYLSIVIIGVIVIVIMSIFGIFTGIDYLNKSIEYKNDSYEDRRYEDELENKIEDWIEERYRQNDL